MEECNMHFEILVEDISGKTLLDIIVPEIIGKDHTFCVHPYKGCGSIPKNLRTTQDPSKRILLEQLPRLLQGYGRTYNGINYEIAIIVVVDCDNRNCKGFKQELNALLLSCNPKPLTFFRIAIEEMEAWLIGDIKAIETVYPKYNAEEYRKYKQDSIVGTWAKLADITLPKDNAKALKDSNFIIVGRQKSE
jgi:hypothetical protein